MSAISFHSACCCVEANSEWDVEPLDSNLSINQTSGLSAPRNVIARGMKRFEIDKVAPPQPEVEVLSPRVISVLAPNPRPFTLNGTNCYIVGTGKERILIDTGEFLFGNQEFLCRIERALNKFDITLSQILITHLHHDHYGGVSSLLEKFGPIPVKMIRFPMEPSYELNVALPERLGLKPFILKHPSPAPVRFYASDLKNHRVATSSAEWDFAIENMEKWPEHLESCEWDILGRNKKQVVAGYFYMRASHDFHAKWDPKNGDLNHSVELKDNDVITTEGATLRVMHTPGHSENHACFFLEEENCMFSGDHVLGFGTTVIQDLKAYMDSLRRMIRAKPEKLYCGHGPHIKDGLGLLLRYVKHRQMREDQVSDFLKEVPGSSVAQIVSTLYSHTETHKIQMATENIEKIIYKLEEEHVIEGVDSNGDIYSLPRDIILTRLRPEVFWRHKTQCPRL